MKERTGGEGQTTPGLPLEPMGNETSVEQMVRRELREYWARRRNLNIPSTFHLST